MFSTLGLMAVNSWMNSIHEFMGLGTMPDTPNRMTKGLNGESLEESA